MKAESMQSPVDKYKITEINSDYAEIEFFENITEIEKKENFSEETITAYEYDYYRIQIRNRNNLSEYVKEYYSDLLKIAFEKDYQETISDVLKAIKTQYKEYSGMDTPSTIEEMKRIDSALSEELINMLIDLRSIMYSLQSQTYSTDFKLSLPKPSEELKHFKDLFNTLK